MLDKYLNGTPTFYKWDKFWVGAVPALIVPLLGLAGMFLITFVNAKYNYQQNFTVHRFISSLQSAETFMRVSTLCCILNGFLFFFFANKDYNNAARGVMLVTMLLVIAILVKEII